MTRIRQFAKDMSISYDKAKKLVDKGKKRKDGGSNILEGYMPIKIVPKKKKVPMPKARPTKPRDKKDPFRADKTESLNKEFSKKVTKQNEVKKSNGGTNIRKPRKGEKLARTKLTDMEKAIRKIKTQIDMIPINVHKNVVKKAMGGLKDVPPGNKGKGLSKLPTAVRNKMGFKKKGGTMKMRGGGMAIQGTGFRGVR